MRTPFCFIISFPPDTKGSFLFEYIISLFILKKPFLLYFFTDNGSYKGGNYRRSRYKKYG